MIRPSLNTFPERPAVSMGLPDDCAFLVLDGSFRVRLCNGGAAKLLGAARKDIVGAYATRFLVDLPFSELALNSGPVGFTARVRGQAGLVLTAVCESQMWAEEPALLIQLYCREAAEPESCQLDLMRFKAEAERSDHGVCMTDSDGRIVYANPAMERQTGYTVSELLGNTPRLFRSGIHPPAFYAKIWETLRAGKEFCAVFVNRRKNGELYYEKKRIRPFIGAGNSPTHYVATGRDISQHLLALEKLEYLANHDSLTGLPNRSLYRDRLHREFIRAGRYGGGFAVCYVDVDQLKPVNDLYGHAAGDALLKQVAEALSEHLRKEDTVARLGGDEFGLILKDVSSAQGVRKVLSGLMCKLRMASRRDPALGHAPMSVSIGVSLYPRDGKDEMDLMLRADRAMYRAKASGGGGFRFYNRRLDARKSTATGTSDESEGYDQPIEPHRFQLNNALNPDLLYYLNLIDPTV